MSRTDNPISPYFEFNADEPTQISKLRSSDVIFVPCLESVAEEKSICTINLKSFNYLKSIGRLIFTENKHLTLLLQRHANDSQVAKPFWIAYYSVLRCWRSTGKGLRV